MPMGTSAFRGMEMDEEKKRFSAGAMLFGSGAELREQSGKPENFFGLDLKQIGDLLNSESLAQHFESRHLLPE